MLTDQQIANAKASTSYSHADTHHEHEDCVRIAYEWLAAQERANSRLRRTYPMKHMIEQWAGRYVSQSDVEVAAHLLGLKGSYPNYYISGRLTEPALSRLTGIAEAGTQDQRRRHDPKQYKRREENLVAS